MMTYIQARRLVSMMTSKQKREIQMLAQAAREMPVGRCERFDPITASCAPTCGVCSHSGLDCAGMGSAPVEVRVSSRYPRLSAEQAKRLRCVFLTHSHADHTGALPWLRSMGYTGPVIASHHTLDSFPFIWRPGFLWKNSVPAGRALMTVSISGGAAADTASGASGTGSP